MNGNALFCLCLSLSLSVQSNTIVITSPNQQTDKSHYSNTPFGVALAPPRL